LVPAWAGNDLGRPFAEAEITQDAGAVDGIERDAEVSGDVGAVLLGGFECAAGEARPVTLEGGPSGLLAARAGFTFARFASRSAPRLQVSRAVTSALDLPPKIVFKRAIQGVASGNQNILGLGSNGVRVRASGRGGGAEGCSVGGRERAQCGERECWRSSGAGVSGASGA